MSRKQVKISLAPLTILKIQTIAEEENISFRKAVRMLIVKGLDKYYWEMVLKGKKDYLVYTDEDIPF